MVNNCLEALKRSNVALRDIVDSKKGEFDAVRPLFAKLLGAGLLPKLMAE